jgi:hypothetical protein
MAQYRVNKKTNILKNNPNKKDEFGDVGTDVVGTLQAGQIIEITKVGGGGRGIVRTPYLFFADDTYIIGYYADKYVSPFGDSSKLLNVSPDLDLGKGELILDNTKKNGFTYKALADYGFNPNTKIYGIQTPTDGGMCQASDGRKVGCNGLKQYEEGLKAKSNSSIKSNETFLQKHKNHLLIIGALFLGYLAYKKFNK